MFTSIQQGRGVTNDAFAHLCVVRVYANSCGCLVMR